MPAVIALLGPTNTGKTYHAVERLLAHRTGMIGFPLRLLARENYDRLVELRGAEAVALITGEERIVPSSPRYFIGTVEAMPLDRKVDFLAVDEIQLAADRERGHVFTDRLLRARGLEETMFLGAETIKPLLRRLVPEAAFIARERLSTLTYAGHKKLDRLPRRSAIVVFSLADLYEMAERVRHETGGAAVVFGALSPRTRNAQVALYQAGEVDYLVATDAIGMGLNLDIDHVAFTALGKFDGRGPRPLRPAEVAQIAGRAGRHTRDGTFGPTLDLGPFDERLVEAVEDHHFEPLDRIFWRNPDLVFASPAALLSSLERRPPSPVLVRMREADDHRALAALSADGDVRRQVDSPEAVRLLWDVAQVPDFRNVMTEAHTRLLAQVFRHLRSPAGRLPEDWVAAQVAALDRTEGDVETLLARIAHIRTWTYVAHRRGWLADPAHWQQRTRAVEDRLSDTLHERLTEQFVERGAAVVSRISPEGAVVEVAEDGEVRVQGLAVGRLLGFRFDPDPGLSEARGLRAVANRALRAHMGERVRSFAEEPDSTLALGAEGHVLWRGAPVGRLLAGDGPLSPRVEPLPSDLLDPAPRERVRRRLAAWVDGALRARLPSLAPEEHAAVLSPPLRGLLFAWRAGLGTVARRDVSSQLAALTPADRRELSRRGISLGRLAIFAPVLLRPDAVRLRALLWSVHRDAGSVPLLAGAPSVRIDPRVPSAFYVACGYVPAGPRAVRADRAERLAAEARKRNREGKPVEVALLATVAGCPAEDVEAILAALGFVRDRGGVFREGARRATARRGR
ncbi:MAG TPA: helicase-related protein [Vicinamibacteria bacterium]|nr:helicase-related protein [Vicinamibacteria bacterium]